MGSRVDASVRVKESLHAVKDWPPASYRLAGMVVLCCLCASSIRDGRATATFGTRPMEAGGNKRTSSSPVKRGVR